MSARIDGYVGRMRDLLPGPTSARAGMLCELSDGLYDAAEAHVRAGVPAEEAQARAVAECGPAEDTAAAYRPELTAAQGRHTAMLVAVLMPGLNLVWDVLTGAVGVVGAVAFAVTLSCSVAMMVANADGPSQAFATSWIGLLVGSVTVVCACLLVRSLVRSLRSAFAAAARTPSRPAPAGAAQVGRADRVERTGP